MFSEHGRETDCNAGENKKEMAAAAVAVVNTIKPSGTKHEAGLAGGSGEGGTHPPCYLEEASWWSILTFG